MADSGNRSATFHFRVEILSKGVKIVNYVSEVAQMFLSLNPDIRFPNPPDYVLISEWTRRRFRYPFF